MAGVSRLDRGQPPLGEGRPVEQLVDPLPQALILTAIVIGFAVQGVLLALLVVTWRRSGTLDVRELASATAESRGQLGSDPSQ